MISDLRHYLREATAEQHQQLDSQPALRALMRPGLTLVDYTHTLGKLAVAFRHVEDTLRTCPLPENPTVPAYLPRYPAIIQDLATLRSPPTSRANLPAPPSIITPYTTLGIRYVIDGSSQGSVHILRKLDNHLPELAAIGARYYWQVQMQAGQDWPRLCEALMPDFPESERQQALAGACWTLGCFNQAFIQTPGQDAILTRQHHLPSNFYPRA